MGPHPYPDLVARMQSVISEEIKWQLEEKIGRNYPDYLIACIGGGSNAAGTIYHYMDDERVRIVLAEAGGQGYNTDYTAATFHRGTVGRVLSEKTGRKLPWGILTGVRPTKLLFERLNNNMQG